MGTWAAVSDLDRDHAHDDTQHLMNAGSSKLLYLLSGLDYGWVGGRPGNEDIEVAIAPLAGVSSSGRPVPRVIITTQFPGILINERL